ncbi:TPA: hypothetical protein ACGOZD_001983 [Streptococcus suis]
MFAKKGWLANVIFDRKVMLQQSFFIARPACRLDLIGFLTACQLPVNLAHLLG